MAFLYTVYTRYYRSCLIPIPAPLSKRRHNGFIHLSLDCESYKSSANNGRPSPQIRCSQPRDVFLLTRGQIIQAAHRMAQIQQGFTQVGADKAGPTSDEKGYVSWKYVIMVNHGCLPPYLTTANSVDEGRSPSELCGKLNQEW